MLNAICPKCTIRWTLDAETKLALVTAGIQPDVDGVLWLWCEACAANDEAARRAAGKPKPKRDMADEWAAICPVEYRTTGEGGETDFERVDQFRAFDQDGIGWSIPGLSSKAAGPKPRPVLIAGDPGTLKTRASWRIARAAFDCGNKVESFTAWSFQAAYQDAAGQFRSEAWMAGLLKSFILLDDIGKSPWTDNTAAAFFELVERVCVNHGQLVLTSNDKASEILAILGTRRGMSSAIEGAIARRFREFFLMVLSK